LAKPRPAVAVLAGVLGVVLVASVILAITFGPADITPGEVWASVLHHLGFGATPLSELRDGIVWELRMPRVLTAGAVGAGLAVSGAVMQALTRNPLADPYLLGLSSGASLGAVLVLLMGAAIILPLAAFLGALLALVDVRLGRYTHPKALELGKRGEVKFTLRNLPAECFESRSEVPECVFLEGGGVPEPLAGVLFGFDNLEGPDKVGLAAFLPYLLLNAVNLH